MKYIIMLYILWNIITFGIMGIDKYKAKNNKWRISEATLLLTAICMGGIGSLIGSKAFRHKTQKVKFKIILPLSVLLNLGVIIYLITGKIIN